MSEPAPEMTPPNNGNEPPGEVLPQDDVTITILPEPVGAADDQPDAS